MKTIKSITGFFFLFLYTSITGQNSVHNPGFELYSFPPSTYNELGRASGWSNCNGNYSTQGTWGSPDYLSLLGSGVAQLHCGYITCAYPHSGNGVAGFITYNGYAANCREYIRTFLTSPMMSGVNYQVSLWLNNGTSRQFKYVTNNVGILFSKDSIWQSSVCAVLNRQPQLNINSVIDTTSWKKYTFNFTADSAYKYITIGNYFNDANTMLVNKNSGGNPYAYVLIDDVSVERTSATVGMKEINSEATRLSLLPNSSTGEFFLKGDRRPG